MWEVRQRSNNAVVFSAPSQAECTIWLSDNGLIRAAPVQHANKRFKEQRWANKVHKDYVMVDTRLDENTNPVFRTSTTQTKPENN